MVASRILGALQIPTATCSPIVGCNSSPEIKTRLRIQHRPVFCFLEALEANLGIALIEAPFYL